MSVGRRLSQVKVGEELPPLDVPLTAAIIVGGAIASRDYTPVHHDRSAAQATGMSDVFMNILTTNGYVGRYVTDWAAPTRHPRGGDQARRANLPGDTMSCAAGEWTRGGQVEVEVARRTTGATTPLAASSAALPSLASGRRPRATPCAQRDPRRRTEAVADRRHDYVHDGPLRRHRDRPLRRHRRAHLPEPDPARRRRGARRARAGGDGGRHRRREVRGLLPRPQRPLRPALQLRRPAA
jgi:hypothetical protein